MRPLLRQRSFLPALLAALAVGCGKAGPDATAVAPAGVPANAGMPQPAGPVPPPAPATEAKGQLPPRDPAQEAAAAQKREAQVKEYARAEAKLAEAIRSKHSVKDAPKAMVGKIRLFAPMRFPSSATLSPDGTRLALGESVADVFGYRIHDLATDAEVCRISLPGASGSIQVAFSPDGSALAVGEGKKRISLWDTTTGKLKNEFPIADLLFTLLFTPDGSGLLVGTFGKVSILDAATGAVRRTFGTEQAWNPAVSPDGSLVAAYVQSFRSGKNISLWETATGRPIGELKSGNASPNSLRFSPDGRTLYFQLDNRQQILSWDLQADKPKDVVATRGSLYDVLSPDGRSAAFRKDPELVVADVASGAETKTKVPGNVVGAITFFPGGTLLGTFENGAFTVWDLAQLRPVPK